MTDFDLGNALQELIWRISLEGTPVRKYEAGRGGYTCYVPPWFVIDKSEAEPDVNWPGRLVGSFDDLDDAKRARLEEIGRIATAEILPSFANRSI